MKIIVLCLFLITISFVYALFNKEQNLDLYNIIKNFYKLTNVPVILNTSFNDAGDPIVESPEDALETFFKSFPPTFHPFLSTFGHFMGKSHFLGRILGSFGVFPLGTPLRPYGRPPGHTR